MRAGSATEIIVLSANIFCDRGSLWNKYLADWILHHTIFIWRKKIRLPPAFDLPNSTPDEKIQHKE
jgi:hypothetical protein